MSAYIVQESIHADYLSRHGTEREAATAIAEMVEQGLAEPGELNIREIDDRGGTVRVFSPPNAAGHARKSATP